jgi:FixJ family two-component response regulator
MLACIVDDEPPVQSALSALLTHRDFEVHAFPTAEDFSAAALSDPYLLIVDKNLPGMSGIDLVSQERERGKDFEAILITGYADIDSAISAIRLGLYSYLRKPFDLQDFLTDVQGAAERLRRRIEHSEPRPQTGQRLEAIEAPLQQTHAHLSSLKESRVGPKRPPAGLGERLEEVQAVTQFVEDQLLRERLGGEGDSAPRLQAELLDLRESVNAVAQLFLDPARHEEKSLVVEAAHSVVIKGDRVMLEQALRLLVRHALAQTVRRGMVILDLDQRAQEAVLQVVAQEIRADKRSGDEEAHKLDLCRHIAAAHDGHFEISPYLGGIGAQYVMTLPAMDLLAHDL